MPPFDQRLIAHLNPVPIRLPPWRPGGPPPAVSFLPPREFRANARAIFKQARRFNRPGALAFVEIHEFPEFIEYRRYLGRTYQEFSRQLSELIAWDALLGEIVGHRGPGKFMFILPRVGRRFAYRRLRLLSRRITSHPFEIEGELFRFTPVIGFANFGQAPSLDRLHLRIQVATDCAATHLDLRPVRYHPRMERMTQPRPTLFQKWFNTIRSPFQILLTVVIGLLVPFAIYFILDAIGLDISWVTYVAVVVMLVLTATAIWVEGFLALRPIQPPAESGAPYPPASAIIAAYLPNEAESIMETLESFLANDYPAGVQIILAYNTPEDMPIEATFKEMAKRHPNFLPYRVMGSTSKAQNVNAAVGRCTGKFVGVFDADHKPDPSSFQRAWRWLSNGYDIVQGHCLIRNGDGSWVARMVAVEFESMYAASHPGRARFHGFGLFGGSNGYWRTDLLRLTRMHQFMLTEDIDSTLRVLISGHKVGNDPYLISRELAPTTLKQLRNQRLRWAQGWFQVSAKWFFPAMVSRHLTLRQKLGIFHLLAVREFFPWFSIQVVPVMAFWIHEWGLENIDWLVPIFVATTLYTTATGPGTLAFTYRLADPSIKQHKGWFGRYLYESFFFYTPFKNLLSRWSHVKELMHERVWQVTPRTVRLHTEPLRKDDPAPAETAVEHSEAPRGDDHG